MITWVTVWVLTMVNDKHFDYKGARDTYQLTYATREICVKQGEKIKATNHNYTYRCDFQQVPLIK